MNDMNSDTLRILERLDIIQTSIHDLDKRIEVSGAVFDTKLAHIPAQYVSKDEYKEDKRIVTVTRRWTIGTVIAVVGLVLNNIVGLVG